MRRLLFGLMSFLLTADLYMIFNMGSNRGLQRLLIGNPERDIWLLIGISFSVFVVNLLLMRSSRSAAGELSR